MSTKTPNHSADWPPFLTTSAIDGESPPPESLDANRIDELERQLLNGNLKTKRQRTPSMLRSTGVRIIRHGVRLFPERSE